MSERRNADDRMVLIRANAFMGSRRDVLAEFERDVIREAHHRVVRRGGVATAMEMAVVQDALAAMQAAGRQDLTDKGMAA